MKKKFLIFFGFLSLGLAAEVNAEKQNKLLSDLEVRYQNLKSWQSDFEQKSRIEVLDQTLTKHGNIKVVRPDKMRIEYETEPRKIYLFSNKMLLVYQPETKSAQKFKTPDKLIGREALSFLSGLDGISTLFEVIPDLKEAKGFFKIENPELKIISLIPKDENSQLLRLTLGINPKTLTLQEAVLFNASGNFSHYQFNDVEFDKQIDAANFELPKNEKIKTTTGGDL